MALSWPEGAGRDQAADPSASAEKRTVARDDPAERQRRCAPCGGRNAAKEKSRELPPLEFVRQNMIPNAQQVEVKRSANARIARRRRSRRDEGSDRGPDSQIMVPSLHRTHATAAAHAAR